MAKSSLSSPVIARLMLPDDANPAGNCHGGTILKMMEQAGIIAATRFCNNCCYNHPSSTNNKNDNASCSSDDSSCSIQQAADESSSASSSCYKGKKFAGLARFETMSFYRPVYVGNVVSVTADIIFTSVRSVLLKVIVTAEDMMKGKQQITNSGLLWYTCFVNNKKKNNENGLSDTVSNDNNKNWLMVPVPQITPPTTAKEFEEYQKAKSMYENRKSKSNDKLDDLVPEEAGDDTAVGGETKINCYSGGENDEECFCTECRVSYEYHNNSSDKNDTSDDKKNYKTPSESSQRLCQMVLPGDCESTSGIAFGGFVMKLMDNAAGCTAFKHCRTNVVTVCINAMDFTGFIRLGDVVTIDAKLTFCSLKSMEILVTASTYNQSNMDDDHNSDNKNIVAKGIFTFVSLDKNGRPMEVPQLKYETEQQLEQAYEAQITYETSKRERLLAARKRNMELKRKLQKMESEKQILHESMQKLDIVNSVKKLDAENAEI